MEIKPKNAAGQHHGCWLNNNNKVHFFNGKKVGFEILFIFGRWDNHYMDGGIIGCEIYNYLSKYKKIQCFYNKPGKKFGEQIVWEK